MAVIPGADTIGQTEGAPDVAPVKYNRLFGRPNQVGVAGSEAFAKTAEDIQKGQDQAAEFEYGTTKSDYLIGNANLQQQVMQDPDWKTADQRYQEGIADLQTTASSNLQNPKMQQRFNDEAKVEAANGLLKIKQFQQGREKEDGLGTLDNTLAANKTAALADPSSAPSIIAATQSSIDGAVAKGWLTEPQGVKLRLGWATDYGKGYVDSLPDAEAVKVLGASLPQRGAGQAIPSVSSPHPFNVGNVKAPDGGFAAPASPTDGVTLAANTLRGGYRGLNLEQIASKWAPASDHNNPAQWAANVSHASGIATNAVPNLDDPKTVQSLVRGIAVAEKSPQDRANFNPGVIQQGVAAAIAGKKPNLGEATPSNDNTFDTQHATGMTKPGNLDPWNRPVLKNPDGSYSTTSSISVGTDDGEVLIPTVVNGKRLSNDAAIAHFNKTGENLGTFDTADHADAYATNLHNAQAKQRDAQGNPIQAPLSATTGTPADFLDVPTRAVMLREAQARLRSDNAAGTQAYVSSVRDKISYLQSGGDPSNVSLSSAEIASHVPGEEGANLADEYSHALDTNKAVKQIATATPQQMEQILAGHTPTGPEDFRENAASAGALYQAANARQTALYGSADGKKPGNPAAYAIQSFPDVSAAYTLASKNPADPKAFDTYITRLNGTYDTLGVPPDQRRILPVDDAKSRVTALQTSKPVAAVGQIQAMATEAGKWWPKVFGELARAGLPPSFQAISVALGDAPTTQSVQAATTIASAIQKNAESGKNTIEESLSGFRAAGDDGNQHTYPQLIDEALANDQNLNNLGRSWGVAGRAGADLFSGVRGAVRQTALYLSATQGLEPKAAAAQASAYVTSQFHFHEQPGHPPMRLPASVNEGDAVSATSAAIAKLTDKDVLPYDAETDAGHEDIASTLDQRRAGALQGAKSAFWIAVPGADGKGALRAFDPQLGAGGRPVLLANGKPLEIPLSQLPMLATRSRQVASTAGDKNPALLESGPESK